MRLISEFFIMTRNHLAPHIKHCIKTQMACVAGGLMQLT